MNADIESAGAMLTASLAAHEIDAAGAAPPGATGGHPHTCANCALPLVGSFCHGCGQRSHLHRSLLHLGEEVLHGILHFDAKAWRTLPLLVAKPGELTRRYIDGHRTRFVSPLALFLFMIFFLFFVGSNFSKNNINIGSSEDAAQVRTDIEADRVKARAALARAEAALASARKKGGDTGALSDDVDDARAELAGVSGIAAVAGAVDNPARPANGGNSAAPEAHTGIKFIDTAIDHATKNPELAVYKLKNTAYKFSFLLVPISLPFLWLMFFWRPGVTMYDHAVFSLYSLSFMSLLFAAMFLLKFAGLGSAVAALLFVAPPLHMFVQLRGTYGLTRPQALWRTAVLQTVAASVFVVYLALILFLSM